MPCGVVSTYGESGQEWTYTCLLPDNHAQDTPIVDVNGNVIDVLLATEHLYTLDAGQTPPGGA